MRGTSLLRYSFLAESQWSILKYGASGDFQCRLLPVAVHWIKLYFLKMLANQNMHWLVLYQHAPVPAGWNWILSAIKTRTLDALVLNPGNTCIKTNKRNPSDTVSKLKDDVKHWPNFFWNCSIPCAGLGPALPTVALGTCASISVQETVLWTRLGKWSALKPFSPFWKEAFWKTAFVLVWFVSLKYGSRS